MGVPRIDKAAFEDLGYWLAPPPPPPPLLKKKQAWLPRLTPAQKKLWESVTRNILAWSEKFSGKCRTGDAMVYTDSGLKRLARFKPVGAKDGMNDIDERVLGFDGEKIVHARAEGFWVEPSRRAIRANLANGAEITGSPRHPLWVCAQSADGAHQFEYKTLDEMKQGRAMGTRYWTPFVGNDHWTSNQLQRVTVVRRPEACKICGQPATARGLCVSHYSNRVGYHGEEHALTAPHAVTITENLAYTLGALVGDGSINCEIDHRSMGFTNHDAECVARVQKGLSEIGCSLKPNPRMVGEYSVMPARYIKPLLKALGIACLSYSKHIPDCIIESPKPVAAAFLRGLFDTDGTVEKTGTVSFTTVSEKLGKDVQDLLAAFGILSVRRPKRSASGRPTWNVYVMGGFARKFGVEVGFEIVRKQQRLARLGQLSFTCPAGEKAHHYGYPDPIRSVWRSVWRDAKIPKTRSDCDRLKRLCSFGSVPGRHKLEEIMQAFGGHDRFKPFLLSHSWLEITSISDTTAELYDLCVPACFSFLASGTINHNTWGCLNKLVRHCYDNKNALAVIVVKEKSMATKGGAWDKLVTMVLPTWRDGNRDKDGQLLDDGLGLHFSDVKYDENHNPMLYIQNRHGGWSRVVLISAPHASQIRARIRGYEASFVFFDELTSVDSEVYFTAINAQIGRVQGIPLQQFLGACNPEGESHWVYQKWFVNAFDEETGEWDPDFEQIHFPSDENRVNVDERYFADLAKTYRDDPVEAARMLDGLWTERVAGDGLFSDLYNPIIHLRPIDDEGKPRKGEILMPHPEHPIIFGVDPGAVYNAWTLQQHLPFDGRMRWLWFDEVTLLKQKVSYPKFIPVVMKRLRWWRDTVGAEIPFVAISDDSAFTVFRPGQGTYDVLDIQRVWAENRQKYGLEPLVMRACPKFADSRKARVRILQTALGQDEIIVSTYCKLSDAMLKNQRSEPQKEGAPFDPDKAVTPMRSDHLHTFDSRTYPMLAAATQPSLLVPTRYNSQTLHSAA